MFSSGTEGAMFTGAWCARCRFAYQAAELCDEAAVILFGEPPPVFLVRIEPSPENPVGVVCLRLEEKAR